MKPSRAIVNLCTALLVGIAISNGDDSESLPEFTLTDQDRDRLGQLGDDFGAEMAGAQTAEARKLAIIAFWEANVLPPPFAQTNAERQAVIETTVNALRTKNRPIFYAVRDGTAVEVSNIQEREVVFAKSIAYMALITDSEKLGPQIPSLLESRRDRSFFSRDDHFAVLVIRDLAIHCEMVNSLKPNELENWRNLTNSANAACRLAAVIAVGRVTSAVSDRSAVFSETVDETEIPILSIIIDFSSVLPPDDRRAFLEKLKNNNTALTPEQVAMITSILE